jgi:putative endonuclease
MRTRAARQKSHKLGHAAEYIAVAYLLLKGYRILGLRHRNPKGEVDIIALKGSVCVAVEVKARRTIAAGLESVHTHKQHKIAGAMQWFMARPRTSPLLARSAERDIRFDVIIVVPWRWPHHIKDAWRM